MEEEFELDMEEPLDLKRMYRKESLDEGENICFKIIFELLEFIDLEFEEVSSKIDCFEESILKMDEFEKEDGEIDSYEIVKNIED
jgi:hypothetical protein